MDPKLRHGRGKFALQVLLVAVGLMAAINHYVRLPIPGTFASLVDPQRAPGLLQTARIELRPEDGKWQLKDEGGFAYLVMASAPGVASSSVAPVAVYFISDDPQRKTVRDSTVAVSLEITGRLRPELIPVLEEHIDGPLPERLAVVQSGETLDPLQDYLPAIFIASGLFMLWMGVRAMPDLLRNGRVRTRDTEFFAVLQYGVYASIFGVVVAVDAVLRARDVAPSWGLVASSVVGAIVAAFAVRKLSDWVGFARG